MNEKFIFEDCALRLLYAKTDDLVLKSALARILNCDIFFEVGDNVILRGDGLWNGCFGEVKRVACTRNGLRYDVLIGETVVEGLTNDDMEYFDETPYREYMNFKNNNTPKNE